MNNHRHSALWKKILVVLVFFALGFVAATWLRAEEPANRATATASESKKHTAAIEISTGKPLPKEVLDKLTPEQLFELEMAKHKVGDIPSLAIWIVLIVFACPVAIVGVVLFYRHRRNAMLHGTLAAMIEKGVPIPPELLQPEVKRRSDLHRGLVLVGVGAGLSAFLALQGNDAWGVGFIPLLMGLGHLAAWKLEGKKQNV